MFYSVWFEQWCCEFFLVLWTDILLCRTGYGNAPLLSETLKMQAQDNWDLEIIPFCLKYLKPVFYNKILCLQTIPTLVVLTTVSELPSTHTKLWIYSECHQMNQRKYVSNKSLVLRTHTELQAALISMLIMICSCNGALQMTQKAWKSSDREGDFVFDLV